MQFLLNTFKNLGLNIKGDYTHLVKVGYVYNHDELLGDSEAFGYVGVAVGAYPMGSMSPNTINYKDGNPYLIEPLTTNENGTSLYTDGTHLNDWPELYLGRSDTLQYVGGAHGKSSGGNGAAYWSTTNLQLKILTQLFTKDDIGKIVPIWLDFNPPSWGKFTYKINVLVDDKPITNSNDVKLVINYNYPLNENEIHYPDINGNIIIITHKTLSDIYISYSYNIAQGVRYINLGDFEKIDTNTYSYTLECTSSSL